MNDHPKPEPPPSPDPACSYCQGRGVLNARAWYALGQAKWAPCPRCGGVPNDD